MNTLLLIIDMQKAFINPNTEYLIEKISNLINANKYNYIVFTRFINTNDSIYVSDLNYYGCIGEDKELVIKPDNHKVIDKKVYSSLNSELKNYIIENNIDKIYLCGINTDCCVLKTAFDLFENEYDFYILKDYCASTNGIEKHNNALEILKRNIGNKRII